jgi:hypothetical protein
MSSVISANVSLFQDRHGPDASKFASEVDPKLLQARLLLNSLIENPPSGSIPMIIDAAMATAMLERNDSNRAFSDVDAKRYQGAMERGEWRHNGEAIKFTSCGMLNDGQHRLTAIKKSGLSIVTDVRFGLPRETFITLDTGKKRTAGDVLSIEKVKHHTIVAAVAKLYWRYSQPTRMTGFTPTHAQIKAVIDTNKFILRSGPEAAKFRSYANIPPSVISFVWALAAEYDLDKANDFFSQLTLLKGIDDEGPARILRRWCDNRENDKGRWPSKYYAAITIKAWNAFVAKKTIKIVRFSQEGSNAEAFPRAVTKAVVR